MTSVTADESVMVDGKIDMSKVNAIAFAPYHHGRYDESKSAGNWRSFYSIAVYNEISHTSNLHQVRLFEFSDSLPHQQS